MFDLRFMSINKLCAMNMSCFVYPMLTGKLREALSIFPVVNVVVLQLLFFNLSHSIYRWHDFEFDPNLLAARLSREFAFLPF